MTEPIFTKLEELCLLQTKIPTKKGLGKCTNEYQAYQVGAYLIRKNKVEEIGKPLYIVSCLENNEHIKIINSPVMTRLVKDRAYTMLIEFLTNFERLCLKALVDGEKVGEKIVQRRVLKI